MIKYICPRCGSEVFTMIHPTNPPMEHYNCTKCGYHKDVWENEKNIEIIAPQ